MSKAKQPAHENGRQPAISTDLLDYIARSPTPFHATANALSMFVKAGYTHLDEGDHWDCKPGSNYVVTRNDSSIIAFHLGTDLMTEGFRMVGAHTDSPCLRIKPKPEINKLGYLQLGVEVYGGVLLHPWLDRDLSIAGRVTGVDATGELRSELIDFKKAVGIIPNLAIHLDRTANTDSTINPQLHMPVVLGQDAAVDFKDLLMAQCSKAMSRVLDYELSCYDVQAPGFVGLQDEFISAARLDNLLSTYVGARALLDAKPSESALFISTDHEEVGSVSACGAQGPFLRSVLERLVSGNIELTRLVDRSSLISSDNAHGIHPNHAAKHDDNHGPILNQGPVIKINNNQRYASNSISSARFQQICERAEVPVQKFVTRSDVSCGSTIGPITAGELGIETVDVGVPQWAMHSIRETAGSKDVDYLHRALQAYLQP